jgi:hypothetical protein
MSEITKKELFEGRSTLIKNREFFPTKTYVEPFFEKMSKFTDDFRIQVKYPDQMTVTKNNTDITFNRVLVQAVLPEKYKVEAHDEVIGFLYGIDVKKPVCKIYRGYLNCACTNLSVFSPKWINVQELLPDSPLNFKPIEELLSMTNNFASILKKLKNFYIDRSGRKTYLGEWVDYALRESEDYGYGKVKIAVSTPIDAYKSLFIDQESDYYIPEGIDPCMFDVYNAFTQVITDDKRDLMNKFEKTMIINRLLDINRI